MEDLTKQQIILLTLLVSFVTSIATGIVTVSLMDQAPTGVTQTINRVVERTIERVVPVPSENPAAVITTKETIVVKEDDLMTAAVEKNAKSLVRIYENGAEPGEKTLISLGFVYSKEGILVTPKNIKKEEGISYSAEFLDGKMYPIVFLSPENPAYAAVFKVVKDEKDKTLFPAVSLANSGSLKLGQTVLTLGGKERTIVSNGIISSFKNVSPVEKNDATASTTVSKNPIMEGIFATTDESNTPAGSLLVNLSGEIVGMRVESGNPEEKDFFLPSNLIKQELAKLSPEPAVKDPLKEKKN